ncbi:polysaccharide deacetylase family protein [Maribacter sp. HTCC2170]|uniref:polysaccharide deacetylase family protein n=1 Tax=Maribacter sp. (strain HTCC2170 / KCCM 42371) TaxID=313603 RepID=UPI00006B48E4|nr:polysaccharide deacetylase family protein [Maribacter sp. HTCC2170]EAR01085.1 hypothetical protein FB2170_09946 [Maribacter sp. HTCC2170]
MNGKLVISLDFELHWGVFDILSVNDYYENLRNTKEAIYKMIKLSNDHNVRLTFSAVGFLFAKDKEHLRDYIPELQPSYDNKKLNPYIFLETISKDLETYNFYFASDILNKISSDKRHEIGTHTFSHYYCNENGQTEEQFDADLEAAKKIAKAKGIQIKSIVFPRNQVKLSYLNTCIKHGITSYRGREVGMAYNPNKFLPTIIIRGLRLLDSYLNIFGSSTYPVEQLRRDQGKCLNLPSSRFLRPYNPRLSFIETLKIRRIKNAMTHAAKNDHLYHLWWHPHNFGKNLDKNMKILKIIFMHYKKLNKEYNFESETMTSLTSKLPI